MNIFIKEIENVFTPLSMGIRIESISDLKEVLRMIASMKSTKNSVDACTVLRSYLKSYGENIDD